MTTPQTRRAELEAEVAEHHRAAEAWLREELECAEFKRKAARLRDQAKDALAALPVEPPESIRPIAFGSTRVSAGSVHHYPTTYVDRGGVLKYVATLFPDGHPSARVGIGDPLDQIALAAGYRKAPAVAVPAPTLTEEERELVDIAEHYADRGYYNPANLVAIIRRLTGSRAAATTTTEGK